MTDTAFSVLPPDEPATGLPAHLVRRIAVSLDLRETLQVVAEAVVENLGFGVAVVNLITPDDRCEVAAVAGPPDAVQALIGTSAPADSFRSLLSAAEPWGELCFLDHRKDDGVTDSLTTWSPQLSESDEPDAWHPDDILLAPLNAPDGTLIGVLSVDIPLGGRQPDLPRRRLLEQFAAHAALVIENARIHTLMSDSEQLFRAMFDRSPIAIALLFEDRRVARVNPACVQLLGREGAELVGRPAMELSRPGPAGGEPPGAAGGEPALGPAAGEAAGLGAAAPPAAGPGDPDQYEVHFARPDGTEIWGRVNSTPLAPVTSGGPRLILTQVEDITQLRAMQAEFAHAASHDQLTGLANRALVIDRLARALSDVRQGGGRIAVLYVDVDHFKRINDTLGHAAGDQLLAQIGQRLTQTSRAGDVAGRLGGDEFVLMASPVPTADEAVRLADRVLRSLCRPVRVGDEPLLPSVSIGVALSGPDDTADSLIAAADRALYAAKDAGRGRWRLADV